MPSQWTEKIMGLLEQLKLIGYHDFQIKDIMHDAGGSSDWHVLREDKLAEVAEYLEAQIEFARRCHLSVGKR